MNGMPSHEWRCVSERAFERLTATLIAEVIHEGYARGPHPRPRMGSTGDEHLDDARPLAKQFVQSVRTNFPCVGVEVSEITRLQGTHGLGLLSNGLNQ